MSSSFDFVKALLKNWGILVTSGVGIGALGIWQGTGHYIAHWIYSSVAAIGLVGASYKAWDESHQEIVRLKQKLKGFQQENKRELIRVITALRALQDNVLFWRDIVKDKWGRAPDAASLVPEEWSTIIFRAGEISADLRKQVESVGNTLAKANSTISEFLAAQANFRDQRLMPIAYQLLDEAAPRLFTVITEFEVYERSLG